MANENETVEQMCETETKSKLQTYNDKDRLIGFAQRILAANKRELAAKDAEIATKDALIKKLTNAFNNLKRKICKGNFATCKNKGKLGLCKFCELVAKTREVANG